jgi:WD40 repeat protein
MEECLLESAQTANSRLADLVAKGENIFRTPSTLTSNVTPRSPQEAYYDYEGNMIQGLTSALERNLRLFNAGRRSSTPSYLSTPTPTRVPFTNFGNGPSTVGWNSGSSGSNNSNYTANSSGTQNQAALGQNLATVGIRSLSINPSRTLLAVGSGDLLQVTIYKIPEFEPIGVMYGHTDLVFSLTWVSDTVLVTGSKDGSMRVWSMDSPILTTLPSVARPIEVRQPVITRTDPTSKVRYLTLNKGTGVRMLFRGKGYVTMSKQLLLRLLRGNSFLRSLSATDDTDNRRICQAMGPWIIFSGTDTDRIISLAGC